MLFKANGNKQTLDLDGCEVLGLLKFVGKTDATSKLSFRVADGFVIAYARNGVGAELFIRGNAPPSADYECTIDASVMRQIKIEGSDTISIVCGGKAKLSLKHTKETEAAVEFAIHNHFSSQIKIEGSWKIPTRPSGELFIPYSIELDWGLYGMLAGVVKYSGSNRVRQYTSHEANEPLYVEFGTERADGQAKWFATFNPYFDDDGEAPDDEGRQLPIPNDDGYDGYDGVKTETEDEDTEDDE